MPSPFPGMDPYLESPPLGWQGFHNAFVIQLGRVLAPQLRPKYYLLPDARVFGIRDPIPRFPLPLASGDDEPEVDLRAIVDDVYDTFAYGDQINYRRDPVPRLARDDAEWADRLLREAGRR